MADNLSTYSLLRQVRQKDTTVDNLLQAQSEHTQLVISERDNLHRNPETAQILAETKLLTNFLFAVV